MAKPVLTKADFVKRYQAGEFGNASPTWEGYAEWRRAQPWKNGIGDLYHIRNRVAGGPTFYNVHWQQMEAAWVRACFLQHPRDYYISAMAPTDKTTCQGEVSEGVWGLQLHYSLVPNKPMRAALAEGARDVTGLVASIVLGRFLNDLSYGWLRHLLEEYPSHVVEFSAYSVCWGTVPGHNTVFWEVRKY